MDTPPEDNLSPVPDQSHKVSKPISPSESTLEQNQAELEKAIREGNKNKIRQIAENAADNIKSALNDPRAKTLAGAITVLSLAAGALYFKSNEQDTGAIPTPTPHPHEVVPGVLISEVSPEPPIVKKVEPGESISSIIASFNHEKYYDQNGKFKGDDETQAELYDLVREVLDRNRETLEPKNPELYQAIDTAEAQGRHLTGLELKNTVRETGGEYEVINIHEGDTLNLPPIELAPTTEPELEPLPPGVVPDMTATPALAPEETPHATPTYTASPTPPQEVITPHATPTPNESSDK